MKKQFSRKGFTLIELITVLCITAALAAILVPSLVSYWRAAEFRKYEENAKTMYLAAQTALTHYKTSGQLEDYANLVRRTGEKDLFPDDAEKSSRIYAVRLDKGEYAAGAEDDGAAFVQLLDDYTYDKSILDASICMEVNVDSGQVYSVFYTSTAGSLSYDPAPADGAVSIADRSYEARREKLVGYYSADDLTNVVDLQQVKLKVRSLTLVNGETLSLNWSSNSRHESRDVVYSVAFHRESDNALLFSLQVDLHKLELEAGYNAASTKVPLTVAIPDPGNPSGSLAVEQCWFPMMYQNGQFSLTLDAMMSAQLMQGLADESAKEGYTLGTSAVNRSSNYSITRLLSQPENIYAQMQINPGNNSSVEYTASSTVKSNTSNTMFANGSATSGGTYAAKVSAFRHLSNIRYMEKAEAATYSVGVRALNWTSNDTLLYDLPETPGDTPESKLPVSTAGQAGKVMAFPTIPRLPEKQTLEGGSVTLRNLQLRTNSVAPDSKPGETARYAQYVGLFGENHGTIRSLTLENVDAAVNLAVKESSLQAAMNLAKKGGVLTSGGPSLTRLRGVGAVCGLNTGTLQKLSVTNGSGQKSSVAAAVACTDSLTGERLQNGDAVSAVRGIGGIAGISYAAEKSNPFLMDTLKGDGAVTGVLQDATASPTADSDKDRYLNASRQYLPVGIGGVAGYTGMRAGTLDHEAVKSLENSANVLGNQFTGGLIGTLSAADDQATHLKDGKNDGIVLSSVTYENGKRPGQFTGGILGYGKKSVVQSCSSAPGTADGFAYKSDRDSEKLKGNFVGGITGFLNDGYLKDCSTGNGGYVLGGEFVGGIVGGLSGGGSNRITSTVSATKNESYVLGVRYVGGIAGANGAQSTVTNCINNGVAAATTEYVGGIVGRNDGTWALSGVPRGEANITDCTSFVYDHNDAVYNMVMTDWAAYANYSGGIAGYSDEGSITYSGKGMGDVNLRENIVATIVTGRNYVGGVVGYNGEKSIIDVNFSIIGGKIDATEDCVGGFIGFNRNANVLSQAVTVMPYSVSGRHFVGGVIGANIVPTGTDLILTGFRTNNSLATIEADGVCGGLIGYNRLVAPGSPALIPTISADGILSEEGTSSGALLTVRGEAGKSTNNIGLRAAAYAGGVIGFNAGNSRLLVENCTNTGAISRTGTPALFAEGVNLNAYLRSQGYTDSQLVEDDLSRASILGGILGVNSQRSVVKNCVNSAPINGSRVLGGIAGLNEGLVLSCNLNANTGSSEQNVTGGIVGVNVGKKDATVNTGGETLAAGTVRDSSTTYGKTISGNGYLGGIAGLNLSGGTLLWTNACGVNAGVAGSGDRVGGIAGENRGVISLSSVPLGDGIPSLRIRGRQDVGILAGRNGATGTLTHSAAVPGIMYINTNVSVSGASNVGGLVGSNTGALGNLNARFDTYATVRASKGNAGGIAGVQLGGTLLNIVNWGDVTADEGAAGGVTAQNDRGAIIDKCSNGGNVSAPNGLVGGVAAQNDGDMTFCSVGYKPLVISSYHSYSLGGITSVNNGTLANCTVLGDSVTLKGSAGILGGIVGVNNGSVATSSVHAYAGNSITLITTASNMTVGGAAGVNNGTVDTARVEMHFKFSNYQLLGGIAGENRGTVKNSTFDGTINETGSGAERSYGGIVGRNGNGTEPATVSGCVVEKLTLQAVGYFSANAAQSAEEKVKLASHIGGAVGRNMQNATIDGCIVGTVTTIGGPPPRPTFPWQNTMLVQSGMVGGIVGANSGTVRNSGGNKQKTLVDQIVLWLSETSPDGTPKSNDQINADRNAMVKALTDTSASSKYAALKGSATRAQNELTIEMTVNGYLGGVAGFNSLTGHIEKCASGKWYLYGNRIRQEAVIGGVIGQNESEQKNAYLLNSAYVRRFSGDASDTDDDLNASNRGATQHYVGGVIGEQQNRTSTDWNLSGLVNYGSVFNSRSHDAGGVIARWRSNGGTLQNCYNFGTITTNYYLGSNGGAGGVVGFINEPTTGVTINILSSQNHGVIAAADQETPASMRGANDCGGIVGKVTTQAAGERLVINVIDCVNGPTASIRAVSMGAGIFGWLGGLNGDNTQLNIDRCRNLSTQIAVGRDGSEGKVVGILGTRQAYGVNGHTAITNCFSVYGGDGSQNSPLIYKPFEAFGGASSHLGAPYDEAMQGSGNNYFLDVNSILTPPLTLDRTLGGGNSSISKISFHYNKKSYASDDYTNGNNKPGMEAGNPVQNFFDGTNGSHGCFDLTTANQSDFIMQLDLSAATALGSVGIDKQVGGTLTYYMEFQEEGSSSYTEVTKNGSRVLVSQTETSAATDLNANNLNTKGKKVTSLRFVFPKGYQPSQYMGFYEVTLTNTSGTRLVPFDSTLAGENPGISQPTQAAKAQRLYVGTDQGASVAADGADDFFQYFGALMLDGTKVASLNPSTAYINKGDGGPRMVLSVDDAQLAALSLLFNDKDGSGVPSLTDISDEAIQGYYRNILDVAAPNPPTDVTVRPSDASTDNVYGKYLAEWKDSSSSVVNYEVEVYVYTGSGEPPATLPDDPEGSGLYRKVRSDSSYEKHYSFTADSAWAGQYFFVRVRGCNTKGSSPWAYSASDRFRQALPAPDFRLQLKFDSGSSTYKYFLRLTNAEAYNNAVGENNWKVTASFLGQAETYSFNASTPEIALSKTASASYNTSLRAYADPQNGAVNNWIRSDLYSTMCYVPGIYPDGTNLTVNAVRVLGTTIDDLSCQIDMTYNGGTLPPVYRVEFLGKVKNSTAVTDANGNSADLKGQYVTLAQKELALTNNTTTTVNLSGLPKDLLTNYEDFQLCAWPAASGLGPVYTWADANLGEVAPVANSGRDARDAGYGIVLNQNAAEGADRYTYYFSTPLSRLGDVGNKYYRQKASFTILPAPVLDGLGADQPVIDPATNQMHYTFTWQPAAGDATSPQNYQVSLTGLINNSDGSTTTVPIDVSSAYTNPAGRSLTVNADSWNYDQVVLKVTRQGVNSGTGTPSIGDGISRTYPVARRLPQINQPSLSLISRDNLRYTMTWQGVDDRYHDEMGSYVLYLEDQSGAVHSLGSLSIDEADAKGCTREVDLEAYQGQTVAFYVTAEPKSGSTQYKTSPIGVKYENFTVPTRRAAPVITSLTMNSTDGSGNLKYVSAKEFANNALKLNATVTERLEGNYLMSAYFYQQEADARAALAALSDPLNPLPTDTYGGDGVIMGFGGASGSDFLYTHTMQKTDTANAGRWALVRMRGTTQQEISSLWAFSGTILRLPGIKLDTPGLNLLNQNTNLSGKSYSNPEFDGASTSLALPASMRAFEWEAVTEANTYDLTITHLPNVEHPEQTLPPIHVRVTTAPVGEGEGEDGRILSVKVLDPSGVYDPALNPEKYEIPLTKPADKSASYYDLGFQVDTQTGRDYKLQGRYDIGSGNTAYYQFLQRPMLYAERTKDESGKLVYRLVLPDTAAPLGIETKAHNFTKDVEVTAKNLPQTDCYKDSDAKKVEVPYNIG